MSLNLIVTEQGRAALLNAQQTGTDAVTIVEAGISATALVPAPGLTALPGELRRVATVGGIGTAEDTIHVSILDESDAAYSMRSFALYLDDGRIFAIYGQADPILVKTADSTAAIAVDCIFADISAAAITFGATNFTDPDATTTRKGLIEIATNAEAQAGVDAVRALTPAALAAALLPLLLGRDGAGSGIDADLLDGQHGAFYTNIPARLGYTPANRAGDTFTGGVIAPSLTLAVGGPFMNSTSPNRLAIGNEGTGIERIAIDSTGVVHVGGGRGLAAGSNLSGAGNLRLTSRTAGGTCLTAFDTENFTAAQFVREISAVATQVGSITCTIGGTSYNTTSDYRLKEDLRPIAMPLDRVMSLRPVDFRWKSHNARTDGFLAHELAAVAPYAVTGAKDAVDDDGNPVLQSIDPSKLVALLVAAVQELAGRVAALEGAQA